jgi:hypothetical protein
VGGFGCSLMIFLRNQESRTEITKNLFDISPSLLPK